MEWMSIETAPMDGTQVILLDGGIVAPGFFKDGIWFFWEGEVVDDRTFLNSWIKGFGPTHWMPLPEPPK